MTELFSLVGAAGEEYSESPKFGYADGACVRVCRALLVPSAALDVRTSQQQLGCDGGTQTIEQPCTLLRSDDSGHVLEL